MPIGRFPEPDALKVGQRLLYLSEAFRVEFCILSFPLPNKVREVVRV